MMFYWLDNFTQCLPYFSIRAWVQTSNPTSCTNLLTFYADLTKWPDMVTGRPDTVSRTACRLAIYMRRCGLGCGGWLCGGGVQLVNLK
jgi:hypothetical protein